MAGTKSLRRGNRSTQGGCSTPGTEVKLREKIAAVASRGREVKNIFPRAVVALLENETCSTHEILLLYPRNKAGYALEE
jgi:hypothetical protein